MSSGKWLGTAAIVVGLAWFGLQTFELAINLLPDGTGLGEDVVLMGFFLIIVLPGVFSVYWGARVLETPTKYRIRRASGFSFAILAVYVAFGFPGRILPESYDGVERSALLLASAIVAITLHVITCRTITRREGFHTLGYREFIGKTAIFLIAFLIWHVGSLLGRTYFPWNRNESVNFTMESLIIFSPLFIAWALYRVSVWFVARKNYAGPHEAPG